MITSSTRTANKKKAVALLSSWRLCMVLAISLRERRPLFSFSCPFAFDGQVEWNTSQAKFGRSRVRLGIFVDKLSAWFSRPVKVDSR